MAKNPPAGSLPGKRKTATYADQPVRTGTGGETHQTSEKNVPILTTQQGIPVADDQNSLRIGVARSNGIGRFPFSRKDFPF